MEPALQYNRTKKDILVGFTIWAVTCSLIAKSNSPVHYMVSSIHFRCDLPGRNPKVILLSNSKPYQLWKNLFFRKLIITESRLAEKRTVPIATIRRIWEGNRLLKKELMRLVYSACIMKPCSRAFQWIFAGPIITTVTCIAHKNSRLSAPVIKKKRHMCLFAPDRNL